MRSEVIDAVINERVILVMGAKDTGKTTFIRDLANELCRRGYSVGIIDADIGQSDIGPPTTIGFGIVETVLENLRDAVLQNLYFVGSISPKGHLLPIITGTRKMLDKAFACGVQKILIDTTGLVTGQLGRVLKEHKIRIVHPDVIICLQKNQECEHILKLYQSFIKPRIIRCPPDSECRTRSCTERRNYRDLVFQQYFKNAITITCALSEIGIFGARLFSGIPASSHELAQFSEEVLMKESKEIPGGSQSDSSVSENHIVWGEYLGNELYLITSKRLKYHQVLNIQRICQKVTYIRNFSVDEFENILVGVLDKNQECRSLGILRSIDFQTQQATVLTHATLQDIAGLTLSTYKIRNT